MGTQIWFPPISSGNKSCEARSNIVAFTSASGLSILFMAIINGICDALASSITSTVYFCIDSTAEITKIIMSVTLAPLDLIF